MFKKISKNKKDIDVDIKEKKPQEKKKKESVVKSCKDAVAIRLYEDNLDAFVLKDNRYMDILKITSKDIMNMSDDEIDIEILNFIKILKTVAMDIKLVSMNFPLSTKKHRDMLLKRSEKAADEVRLKWLSYQIDELERVDNNKLTREFYIFIYADNESELIKNKESILKYAVGRSSLIASISKNEKINIVTKLNNMNTATDLHAPYELKVNIAEDKKDMLDTNLFENLQPRGGVSFKEPSYSRFGDGYVRCLRVYELPSILHEFWLTNIFNISGCVCTVDLATKDINEVKKNISRSIKEEEARLMTEKDHLEIQDSYRRATELKELLSEISIYGEVIKLCDFRIYVHSKTLAELEEISQEIVLNLEADSFKLTTLLNEQKSEFQSIYEPQKQSSKKPFAMKPLTLTSEQVAKGFPFAFSQLIDDEGGFLLGFTRSGGTVVFNPFEKTKERKHYSSIVSGTLGSGKSTHLKKLFKYVASIGGYVRVFDTDSEFVNLTKEFGGKIIKCNNKEGNLNPLEILKSGEDDYVSYANHISKLISFFKCIMPSMSDELSQELSNELKRFYSIYNLTPAEGISITGLEPEKYPIFSNFKAYLKEAIKIVNELDKQAETEVETSLNVDKARNLNNILLAVENLTENYANMFDTISSISDISKEKIVTFDISSIKNLGNIFTAQMQNLASLCWDNAVQNGKVMKEKWDSGNLENHEIIPSIILIDESHRWVNTSMPSILDMIIKYMREARKYFTGIVLASQSIRDFVPQTSSEGLEKIRILFELSQYKFMFKQDSSAIEHMQKSFGQNMSYSQLQKIPFLKAGECILSISGDRSIELKEWLSKEYEESIFAGGR